MNLSSKLDRLEKKIDFLENSNRSEKTLAQFLEALDRGVVLCKDGVERSIDDWAELMGVDFFFRDPEIRKQFYLD